MPKRTMSYDEALLEDLRDPEEAAAYLAASLEDVEDPDAEKLFLMALKNVAIAHGMKELAQKAELGRESLYKALSDRGNPKFSTLNAILHSIGLRLAVHVIKKKRTNVMVRAWENVVSCDAIKWDINDSDTCTVRGIAPNELPRRAIPSTEPGWSSAEDQVTMPIVAYGGMLS